METAKENASHSWWKKLIPLCGVFFVDDKREICQDVTAYVPEAEVWCLERRDSILVAFDSAVQYIEQKAEVESWESTGEQV